MGSASPSSAARDRMREFLKGMLLTTRNPDGTPRQLDRADVKVDGEIVAMVFSSGFTVYRVGVFTENPNLPRLEAGRDQAGMRAQLLADQVSGTVEWTKTITPPRLTFFQAQLLGIPDNPPSMRYANAPSPSLSAAA